ncbi:MAG: hypothetical protein C4542_02175 [Dehalococcoidia bacterium]|nr:MAG: hypothetical protein C4542_02175 [Dehalococcoidia bacterium]
MFNIQNIFCRAFWFYVLTMPFAAAAYAEPVTPVDATTLGDKIAEIVKTIGMPLGGAILFLAVCLIAIKMMLSGINPDRKADAMSGLFYVGLGGIILGAAMFVAGAILGIGQKLQ